MTDEDLIKDAFEDKRWADIRAESSWQIFKIMGEFVEGFDKLDKIGPCVTIFGSARTKPENKYYEIASDIAKKLTMEGYGVITGGGPGIWKQPIKALRRLGKANQLG